VGTLDERNRSLWIDTAEAPDYPVLPGDVTADVVVIGGGITGLTTARLLVEEGASVAVVEAGRLCAGATGYTTAKITSLHGLTYSGIARSFDEDRARLYGEANEAGIAAVARLVQQDGIDCQLERRPHIAYTTDPESVEEVMEESELAARLGLPATFELPQELPYEVAGAVRFDNQAQFHPRAYCLGLARAVTERGGLIFEHTRAVDVDGAERTVATTRGRVRGDAVVVATHLPFKQMGGYFARATPSRSYAVAVTVEHGRPEGMYISVDSPTRSLRTAGDRLIVGGEGHKVGAEHDTRQHYDALEAWADQHFPVRSVDYRWSAQDWSAADGIPYIGRMSGYDDGIYVATAFKKWGMSHGTVAGMIFTDLISGRDNPWNEVFDASRLAPRQSIRGVVSENVQALKHLVVDRIDSGADVGGLAPGSGAVVDMDGDKVAAFRDDDGTVHALSAVCTHMGCVVSFNSAERSWDCPCHGSRFGVDGRVIEGPAVADLPRRDGA
jgi:glycine/D-amino acid oxidase-like deaminating enzyme/nitrite reductase/ring-hydroxylating ferredoxin subunit